MSASENKCLNYAIRQILNKTQFTLSVEMFMFREFFNPICDGHTKCRVILIFCNLVVIGFLFNKSLSLSLVGKGALHKHVIKAEH